MRVDPQGREIWDAQYYEELARKREYEGDEKDLAKKARRIAPAERKPLEVRETPLNLEATLGKEIVITAATPKAQQGGFYCSVCDCLVKDSKAWLDHINGRRHNRLLGRGMRVKQATVDDVKSKLENLMQQKEESKPMSIIERFAQLEEEGKRTAEAKRKKRKKGSIRLEEGTEESTMGLGPKAMAAQTIPQATPQDSPGSSSSDSYIIESIDPSFWLK